MSQATNTPTTLLSAVPLDCIPAVDGWQLCQMTEQDRDGFDYPVYVARSADRDVILDVSRFRFTPSAARFAWLVRNGFPARPAFGPWDDTDIEMRMAVPEMAA